MPRRSRPLARVLLATALASALAGCAAFRDFEVSTSADPLTRFPRSATFGAVAISPST